MIIVNLMGGLGNQLFQYAAGRALSVHYKTDIKYVFADNYKLANRAVRIDKFKIVATPLSKDEAKDYFPKTRYARVLYKLLGMNFDGKIFREINYYRFDPEFFRIPSDTYLYGFWQSYSYFASVEQMILDEIVIKNPSPGYQKALKTIQALPNPVAIHVRRGDYLSEKSGFSALPETYYSSANEYIAKRLPNYTPVIFSDDHKWISENLTFFKDAVFASDFHLEDYEELMVMSSCDHNIIANSSFSWWGAWLNLNKQKIVIAPRQWHSLHTDDSQLIPLEWIQL